jgi:hypothetical protein
MRLFLATILFAAVLPLHAADAVGEYIVVSGGPALREWEDMRKPNIQHDRWWGNFVRTARVRMQELEKTQPAGTQITWLVYRDAYLRRAKEDRDPLTSYIQSVEDAYGFKLVWFRTGDDLVDYVNSGMNRWRTKITGFEYFGHSNKHCFMFDYSSEVYGASGCWLHERDLKRLNRRAFDKEAHCQSWGCHTGESMSKLWKKAIGVPMIGAVGKTDYSYMHLRNWTVRLSSGARWTR